MMKLSVPMKYTDYPIPLCLNCGRDKHMNKTNTERLLTKAGTWVYRIDYQCSQCKLTHSDKGLKFD